MMMMMMTMSCGNLI